MASIFSMAVHHELYGSNAIEGYATHCIVVKVPGYLGIYLGTKVLRYLVQGCITHLRLTNLLKAAQVQCSRRPFVRILNSNPKIRNTGRKEGGGADMVYEIIFCIIPKEGSCLAAVVGGRQEGGCSPVVRVAYYCGQGIGRHTNPYSCEVDDHYPAVIFPLLIAVPRQVYDHRNQSACRLVYLTHLSAVNPLQIKHYSM